MYKNDRTLSPEAIKVYLDAANQLTSRWLLVFLPLYFSALPQGVF
jgi:hypothetical protein